MGGGVKVTGVKYPSANPKTMASHCNPGPSMASHGQPWPTMAGHGWPWPTMAFHQKWPEFFSRIFSFHIIGKNKYLEKIKLKRLGDKWKEITENLAEHCRKIIQTKLAGQMARKRPGAWG